MPPRNATEVVPYSAIAYSRNNDVTRDMKAADIVMAIERIEAAVQHGYLIAGEFHNLNLWR